MKASYTYDIVGPYRGTIAIRGTSIEKSIVFLDRSNKKYDDNDQSKLSENYIYSWKDLEIIFPDLHIMLNILRKEIACKSEKSTMY